MEDEQISENREDVVAFLNRDKIEILLPPTHCHADKPTDLTEDEKDTLMELEAKKKKSKPLESLTKCMGWYW